LVFFNLSKEVELDLPVNVNCDTILELVGYTGTQIFEIRSSRGYSSLDSLVSLNWAKLRPEFINIQLCGAPQQKIRALRSGLKSNGYRCLGSGREQTGTDVLFALCSGKLCRVKGLLAWWRFRLGQQVVWMRENLFNPQVNRVRFQRVAHFLGWQRSIPLLDHDFGLGLSKVDSLQARDLAIRLASLHGDVYVPVEFDLGSERSRVDASVLACHDELGVWPISFSFPQFISDFGVSKMQPASEVIPGNPYSFSDYNEYLRQYAESCVAITHRKAGWDCFRHVEILGSGSLPYMLDNDSIPPFSMVHYPRDLMRTIAEVLDSEAGIPVVSNPDELNEYLASSLTCESMANYILRMSGLHEAERVLFVDENLVHMADYLSLFTLIGLKQLLGSNCSVLVPVPYVYIDWEGDSSLLYGRGFGYTRILDVSTRNENEFLTEPISVDLVDDLAFDAIIVGNITRNSDLARELLSRFPAEKTIWIHGEDTPPLIHETEFLVNSGAHVFVRAIH
jgi:hypothetical protein